MDDSDEGKYVMIIYIYLITSLVIDIKFSEHVTSGGVGPYKGCTEPMVDVNNYHFRSIPDKLLNQKSLLSVFVSTIFSNQKYL